METPLVLLGECFMEQECEGYHFIPITHQVVMLVSMKSETFVLKTAKRGKPKRRLRMISSIMAILEAIASGFYVSSISH